MTDDRNLATATATADAVVESGEPDLAKHLVQSAEHAALAGRHSQDAAMYHRFGEFVSAAHHAKVAHGHMVLAMDHANVAARHYENLPPRPTLVAASGQR